MSKPTTQWFTHLSVLVTILISLVSIDLLSWTECLRLLLVSVALGVLVKRHWAGVVTNGTLTPSASVILAITVAFIVTQFDASTAGIHYRVPQSRLNPLYEVSTLAGLLSGLIAAVAYRESLIWARLTTLDRIVLVTVIGAAILALLSRAAVGVPTGWDTYLAVVKVLSYAGWWVAITRVYGDDAWRPSLPVWLGRWVGPALALAVLWLPTIVYGGYRTVGVMTHLADGQAAYERDAWDEARRHYEAADRLNETVDLGYARDRYLSDLAVLQFRLGHDKEAQSLLGRLTRATLDRTDAERKSGDVYLAAERWANAARSYERVLEKGRNRNVQDALGVAYWRLGDSRNFLELANRFAYLPNIEAKTFDEWIFLGNIQFYRDQFGSALEHYRKAADLQPDDAYAEYKVGRALFEQGQVLQAAIQYRRATELEPDFADAHYRIGLCLQAGGDTTGALAKYKETIALLPNHLEGKLAVERLSGRTGEERTGAGQE